MNILVIGGTRFFGIPMVEKLIENGHRVTIATRGNSSNPFGNRVATATMDRTNPDSVRNAIGGKRYELIIDKVAYASNDVKALLENVGCDRYIQMSTCSVYPGDGIDIKENEFEAREYNLQWIDRPEDYPMGKRQAERAAYEFLEQDQCVFVRYPIVMGKNDYTNRLNFYVEHIMGQVPMQIDDFDGYMSFINEREAGEFIAFLADKDFSGPINGASKGNVSPGQIFNYIEIKTGMKAILGYGDLAPYNGVESVWTFNTKKAENLGFTFTDIKSWIWNLLDYYIAEYKKL